MDRPVRRVLLPGEALAWDEKLKLKEWVGSKKWDPLPRYRLVDSARMCWDAMGRQDFADDPEWLVNSFYQYLLKDEQFKKRLVRELKQQITEPEVWDEVTKAYGWVILQRYNRELGGEDDDDD